MKEILIKHSLRYPLMELEDYLKLLYQSYFGPVHIMHQPSKERLLSYLEKELKTAEYSQLTPIVEAINNHYVRVSLKAIDKNIYAKEHLINAFYTSMQNSPQRTKELIEEFKEATKILLNLIEIGTIKLDLQTSKNKISNYINEGINPLHHSETYRLNYHPHYRVIEERLLIKEKKHG